MSSGIPLFLSNLGKFWQDKKNYNLLRWNVYLLLFQFIFLFFRYNDLPPEIPLYFSLPWGESWLTSSSSIFFLPGFSLVVVLINHIFAFFIERHHPLVSRLSLAFSLVFSLFSTIALYQITRLST
jgi:hypothetical protein